MNTHISNCAVDSMSKKCIQAQLSLFLLKIVYKMDFNKLQIFKFLKILSSNQDTVTLTWEGIYVHGTLIIFVSSLKRFIVYNLVEEKESCIMKIQAGCEWHGRLKAFFDSLGGYWVDVYTHSSLENRFIHSISFSLNFKTMNAFIVWRAVGIIRDGFLEEVR